MTACDDYWYSNCQSVEPSVMSEMMIVSQTVRTRESHLHAYIESIIAWASTRQVLIVRDVQ